MDSLMNLLSNLMLRIGVWLQTATVGMDPTAEDELLFDHRHGDDFLEDYWKKKDRYDSDPLHIGSSAWHAYDDD